MNDAQKVIKYLATLFAFVLIGFIFYIPILVGTEIYKSITDEIKKEDNLLKDPVKKEINDLEFSKINIDINTCNISIDAGEEFKLKTNDEKLVTNLDNTALNIESDNKNIFNKNKCKLDIVIPEEIINILSIKNKYGDIKINNLVLNEISINNNVGDIDVNKSKFNTVLINNSVGNIDVDANINEELNIISSIGDITLMINDSIDNYKSNVTKKIGSILVNGINYSKDVSLGSGEKNININSTMGGVSLNFKKEINKEN